MKVAKLGEISKNGALGKPTQLQKGVVRMAKDIAGEGDMESESISGDEEIMSPG